MEHKFTSWMEKQKSYGLMNPPMKAQKAVDMLAYYLDVPPDPNPESAEQTNTYIVDEILYKYSKPYKQEVKCFRHGKRYIFLDVDGVLNNVRHWRKLHDKYGGRFCCENMPFNERSLKNLKKIIDKTQAEVVLISSWRTRS